MNHSFDHESQIAKETYPCLKLEWKDTKILKWTRFQWLEISYTTDYIYIELYFPSPHHFKVFKPNSFKKELCSFVVRWIRSSIALRRSCTSSRSIMGSGSAVLT